MRCKLICNLFGAALIASTQAGAEETHDQLVARSECTPIYAVHMRNCRMQRIYSCEYGGQTILRNESISENGLFFIDFTDLDSNTIESWTRERTGSVVEVIETRDLFSFDEFFANGADSFDITHMNWNAWFSEPVPKRFAANVRSTGEIINVDGIKFVAAKLSGFTQINAFQDPVDFYLYLDKETGAYFWGGSTEDDQQNYTPVEVIFPDDPDFQIERPQYECGVLSQLSPTTIPSEKG